MNKVFNSLMSLMVAVMLLVLVNCASNHDKEGSGEYSVDRMITGGVKGEEREFGRERYANQVMGLSVFAVKRVPGRRLLMVDFDGECVLTSSQ